MPVSFLKYAASISLGALFFGGGLLNPLSSGGAEPEPSSISKDGSQAESSPATDEHGLLSGRDIGEYVPTFYTRAVTGPLMNRSVCYVCRNGQRPVVMVFLRKLGDDFKPLLKQVDRLVDNHRAEGLRSFGVYVSEDPSDAISQVQTFSFDHKITLPLTVASTAVAEPHCQNIHEEADVTVVLYQKRRVVKRYAFRVGEVKSPQIREVSQSIQQLLKAPSPSDDASAE